MQVSGGRGNGRGARAEDGLATGALTPVRRYCQPGESGKRKIIAPGAGGQAFLDPVISRDQAFLWTNEIDYIYVYAYTYSSPPS